MGKRLFEPLTRSMELDEEGRLRGATDLRGLGRGQAVPGDQRENLAVAVRKPAQGPQHFRPLDDRLTDVAGGELGLGGPGFQLSLQRRPFDLGPIGITEYVPRDAE